MPLPVGVHCIYKSQSPSTAATSVKASDCCRIRLSERSWGPAAADDEVHVDLALGIASAPSAVPRGVFHSLLCMQPGDKFRLSLSADAAFNGAGSLPDPASLELLGSWPEGGHEVTVELLAAGDERLLADGITLLRRSPVTKGFRRGGFAEHSVRYHLLTLGDQEVRLEAVSQPTCAAATYEAWLKERLDRGSSELDAAEMMRYQSSLDDADAPIGLVEVLPLLGAEHVAEVLLEMPPDGKRKAILLIHLLEAEAAIADMGCQERITAANMRKDLGSENLSKGKLEMAESCYHAALEFVQAEQDFKAAPEQVMVEAKQMKVRLLSNLTLVSFKKSNWKDVIRIAGKVLQVDAENSKARYRRGVAFARSQKYEEAIRDLEVAAAAEPGDKNIAKELSDARAKLAAKAAGVSSTSTAASSCLATALSKAPGMLSEGRTTDAQPVLGQDLNILGEGMPPASAEEGDEDEAEGDEAREPRAAVDEKEVFHQKMRVKEMMNVYRRQVGEALEDAEDPESIQVREMMQKR
eukprot:TRINITY_DN81793_c0_g1_i1.p1 TRINITY_DN81793_c0_g1~~TRINITY_DN81793_c0_g1_i1.p1  ORF type:complete len:524 (+),score=141.63 TRINITY_DN81793_c0_g1_i1:83-1654(+)